MQTAPRALGGAAPDPPRLDWPQRRSRQGSWDLGCGFPAPEAALATSRAQGVWLVPWPPAGL